MMYHIPGVLSAQDVARFREQLDAADWVDGRATTGAQGAQVKTTSRWIRKVSVTAFCNRRYKPR